MRPSQWTGPARMISHFETILTNVIRKFKIFYMCVLKCNISSQNLSLQGMNSKKRRGFLNAQIIAWIIYLRWSWNVKSLNRYPPFIEFWHPWWLQSAWCILLAAMTWREIARVHQEETTFCKESNKLYATFGRKFLLKNQTITFQKKIGKLFFETYIFWQNANDEFV